MTMWWSDSQLHVCGLKAQTIHNKFVVFLLVESRTRLARNGLTVAEVDPGNPTTTCCIQMVPDNKPNEANYGVDSADRHLVRCSHTGSVDVLTEAVSTANLKIAVVVSPLGHTKASTLDK